MLVEEDVVTFPFPTFLCTFLILLGQALYEGGLFALTQRQSVIEARSTYLIPPSAFSSRASVPTPYPQRHVSALKAPARAPPRSCFLGYSSRMSGCSMQQFFENARQVALNWVALTYGMGGTSGSYWY